MDGTGEFLIGIIFSFGYSNSIQNNNDPPPWESETTIQGDQETRPEKQPDGKILEFSIGAGEF